MPLMVGVIGIHLLLSIILLDFFINSGIILINIYNPQNEAFGIIKTKRPFFQNEMYLWGYPPNP